MKIFATLILATALAGCSQMGQGGMHGSQGMPGAQGMHGKGGMHGMMQQHMQTMDTNRDGMLSREEFMKAHEAMYDSMPKNDKGMVDMKQMSGAMRR